MSLMQQTGAERAEAREQLREAARLEAKGKESEGENVGALLVTAGVTATEYEGWVNVCHEHASARGAVDDDAFLRKEIQKTEDALKEWKEKTPEVIRELHRERTSGRAELESQMAGLTKKLRKSEENRRKVIALEQSNRELFKEERK